MSSSGAVNRLLTANSMRVHYTMMANGLFHNHLTQGIVALYHLGVTEEKLISFVDLSINPKTRIGGGFVKATEQGFDANEKNVISDTEATGLLGKSEKYYQLVQYYDHKLKNQYDGSVEALMKGEMKTLGDGTMSELTHAIIEVGHGYSVLQAGMVVEGMAWLHYAYLPPNLPKEDLSAPITPNGSLSVIQALTALSNDSRLKQIVKATGTQGGGSPGKRLRAIWSSESRTLLDLINQTNLEMSSDPAQAGSKLVDIALTVYIASRKRNEFFLLHGVTGAWSVKQILPALDAETCRMCLRTFLLVIFGTYVMEGSPPFDFSFIPEPGSELPALGWPEIITRTLDREAADPHCYKLVQVCYDLARSAPPEKQAFYKAGALVALDYNDFSRYADPLPS